MAKKVKLGSLYIDGCPMKAGIAYAGGPITIGKYIYGNELYWLESQGKLIADRCACVHVSWRRLNEQGLIFGTAIELDGAPYLLRSLRVGVSDESENEWDTALDELGDDNKIWHWEKIAFWGQESVQTWQTQRMARGSWKARHRMANIETYFALSMGFRPVLEPLGPAPESYDALVGNNISTVGPDKRAIRGKLVAVSDYDLVLEQPSPLPDNCLWAVQDGNRVIIDRSQARWLRQK